MAAFRLPGAFETRDAVDVALSGGGVVRGSMMDVVVVAGALVYSAVIIGHIGLFRSYRRKRRASVQDPCERDYNVW